MAALTGPTSRYNSGAAGSNQTRSTCCICLEDYEKNETEKVRRVVELNCGHYFHTDCFKKASGAQAAYNNGLNCCYCRQQYANPVVVSMKALVDKEELLRGLQQIRDEYSYDEKAVEATFCVQELFDSLNVIFQECRANQEVFLGAMKDLVCNSSSIKDELKGTALMVVGAIISQGGCLRSLEGEARRWAGVPMSEYPEVLKTRGVIVYIEGARVRVSAQYLHRAAKEILMEDIVDRIKRDGDYIASLPGKVVERVHRVGASLISSVWDTLNAG